MYSKKIIVCYLFTGFDKITSFNQFIRHYKKFNSGIKHELLICYKLLKKKKIDILEKKIKDINHHFFIDPIEVNDWDFGSYKRVAQKYNKDVILFMNSHSYPITNFWLKKFKEHEWMLSETYHYKKQSKSIISDKHSRKYLRLTTNERKKSQFNVWGV